MEQVLQDTYGLATRAYKVPSCFSIPSALCDIYSSASLGVGSSKEGGGSSSFHLIVVFDDPLHPGIDTMCSSFASLCDASASATSGDICAPVLEMCIAFDSVSVVPCRELQLRALAIPAATPVKPLHAPTTRPPSGDMIDAKVAKLLSALHQQFETGSNGAASLLSPLVSQVLYSHIAC
jgi:hypothetical protein